MCYGDFIFFCVVATNNQYFYFFKLNTKPYFLPYLKKGIDERGNWRAASPPLSNYIKSSTLPLIPDTKDTKNHL